VLFILTIKPEYNVLYGIVETANFAIFLRSSRDF